MAFTCPRCDWTSHHPEDERHGYCGNCRWWTGDPHLGRINLIVDDTLPRDVIELRGATVPRVKLS